MSEKSKKQVKLRDFEGYEGGPDFRKTRPAKKADRERILSKARRGPVKRFIDKVTA